MYKGKDIVWQDMGNSLQATVNDRVTLLFYDLGVLSVLVDGIERAKLDCVEDVNKIAFFVSDIVDFLSEE